MSDKKFKSKAGIDIGTMNIITARLDQDDEINYERMRDCFLTMPVEKAKMIKLNKNLSYIEKEDQSVILGDEAANIATIWGEKLHRPLQAGVLSPEETNAMAILKLMIGTILGKAKDEGEICYFSSPADPIDASFDTIFHSAMLQDILSDFGWNAVAANEATALAFSEAAESSFSALCISMGSGMVNCSLNYQAIEAFAFSIAKGGDWLDKSASKVTGTTPERVCKTKEEGIDLVNPKGNVESALAVYYKALIREMIATFIKKIKEVSNVDLPSEIPVIIAGGTSKAEGVKELVEQEVEKNKGFPFRISDIRYAEDQLNSVAKGLLVMAQNHDDE